MLTIEDLHPIAQGIDDSCPPDGRDEMLYMFTAEELVEFVRQAVALAEGRGVVHISG